MATTNRLTAALSSEAGDAAESRLAAALPAPTRVDDVFACLKTDGPARTIEDMHAAIVDEARRRADD